MAEKQVKPLLETARGSPASVADGVGMAQGNINFVRESPGQTEDRGARAAIRLNVRSAVGVWQPSESRMRILLLEAAPRSEEVAGILSAVQSGAHLPEAGPRQAMIELKFLPSAQAFDRNDLDSATLVARDGALTSTANALYGLSWTGSLPSPQVTPPPGFDFPSVELVSGGDTVAADQPNWHQSWNVSLTVPVVMRN